MKRVIILGIIMVFAAVWGCKKVSVNPQCWSGCKEATFYYQPCGQLAGDWVFDDNPDEIIQIFAPVPKRMRKEEVRVCVKAKYVEQGIMDALCPKGKTFAKIKCVKVK